MKEHTKKVLTEKKTVLGFEIADIIGVFLLLIPFIISLMPITYSEDVSKKIWFIKVGTITIQQSYSLIPTTIPSILAVAFYGSLIVRYNIFKKDNIIESVISVLRTFLLCWTIASLLKPILSNQENYTSTYLLIAAVVLSWLGMKTIAGYSWIFFIVAAAMNYVKFDEIIGGRGALFIITLAISLFLQIKDLSKISDFVSDFKVSTASYSESVKGEIHAAVSDATERVASAGSFVKQTVQGAGVFIGKLNNDTGSSGRGVNIDFEALDVNKDGVVDEKDIKALMGSTTNNSKEK